MRTHNLTSALGLAAGLALSFLTPSALATPVTLVSRETALTRVVEQASPGVVSLKITKRSEYSTRNIMGTGIIVDERGFILTNHHVVHEADSVTATLDDGTSLEARVEIKDVANDLAILRVKASKKLKALTFGPAADIKKAETVIVIGNPHGYDQTVTTGIVSGLNRKITMPTEHTLTGIIQTSAPINPGNSGGPLLNINGEVIGVVVAVHQKAQGMAFAINADTVKAWLRKNLSAGRVSRVTHGLKTSEEVTAPIGPDRTRVVVVATAADDSSATVRKGDVIVKVGAVPVRNAFDVERAVWGHKPGEQVEVAVLRDGKVQSVRMKLSEPAGKE
jgi:serine protease Do